MSETTLEKMLHTAADLRDRLDGSTMTEGQRAFVQTLLAKLEAAFLAERDQVQAIRAVLPRRDDVSGRATAAYVDRLLGEGNRDRLH